MTQFICYIAAADVKMQFITSKTVCTKRSIINVTTNKPQKSSHTATWANYRYKTVKLKVQGQDYLRKTVIRNKNMFIFRLITGFVINLW